MKTESLVSSFCWIVLSLFGLLFTCQTALAVPATKTAGVALISTGGGVAALTGVGAPFGAFIGGFEIGWGLGCVLFDPADTANAGVPVSFSAYSIYQLPKAQSLFPTIPTDLANALDSQASLMNSFVANVRAEKASLDRYQGAILIGKSDFASARLSEANAFRSQAQSFAAQAVSTLPSFLNVINSYDSSLLSRSVTLTDTLAMRDAIKSGNFPAFEQFALTAWAVTPDEMAALKQRVGSIPDSVFQNMFQQLDPVNGNSTSLGNALTVGTGLCAECVAPVPEPEEWVMMLLGFGMVGWQVKLKQRGKLQ